MDDSVPHSSHGSAQGELGKPQSQVGLMGSSRWKVTAARNPNMVSTCLGTGNACLLLVLCSNMGCRSTHSSMRTALRSKSSSSSRPVDPDGL